MKKWTIILLLIFIAVSGVSGQVLPDPEPLIPEDYDPSEFPLWLQDLRRYEIVAIGSFPITFFLSSLIYDLVLFAIHDGDEAYALGTQRNKDDIGIIIGSAATLSLTIATADIIINVLKRKNKKIDAPGTN